MQAATDEVVLVRAAVESRVLVSADTDFGALLARSKKASPSVLLIRRLAGRRAAEQSAIIRANLDQVAEDLSAGAIVVLSDEWVRIRPLPLLRRWSCPAKRIILWPAPPHEHSPLGRCASSQERATHVPHARVPGGCSRSHHGHSPASDLLHRPRRSPADRETDLPSWSCRFDPGRPLHLLLVISSHRSAPAVALARARPADRAASAAARRAAARRRDTSHPGRPRHPRQASKPRAANRTRMVPRRAAATGHLGLRRSSTYRSMISSNAGSPPSAPSTCPPSHTSPSTDSSSWPLASAPTSPSGSAAPTTRS